MNEIGRSPAPSVSVHRHTHTRPFLLNPARTTLLYDCLNCINIHDVPTERKKNLCDRFFPISFSTRIFFLSYPFPFTGDPQFPDVVSYRVNGFPPIHVGSCLATGDHRLEVERCGDDDNGGDSGWMDIEQFS